MLAKGPDAQTASGAGGWSPCYELQAGLGQLQEVKVNENFEFVSSSGPDWGYEPE